MLIHVLSVNLCSKQKSQTNCTSCRYRSYWVTFELIFHCTRSSRLPKPSPTFPRRRCRNISHKAVWILWTSNYFDKHWSVFYLLFSWKRIWILLRCRKITALMFTRATQPTFSYRSNSLQFEVTSLLNSDPTPCERNGDWSFFRTINNSDVSWRKIVGNI